MSNLKILIVDDVEANIISLEYLLNEYFEKIDIMTAKSGESALKIAFTNSINLIILDIQMPIMDGFETATFLKSNQKTKDIPIIFLTAAFKEEEFQKRGFGIGAIDYLTKPIDNHQFINKLKLYIEIFSKNKELAELNSNLEKTIKNEEKLFLQNENQKKVFQSILDAEQNLVIVTSYNKISFVNNALLEYFDVKNILEFQEKYNCILDSFLDEPNSLCLSHINQEVENKAHELYKLVQECDEANRVIYMLDQRGHKKSFYINVSIVKDENGDDQHLISLTDITKMRIAQSKISKQAYTDALTGVYNRSMFNEIVESEIKKTIRYKRPFSCAIIDIDLFKNVNDTYGHLIGDEVLIMLAQAINSNIRDADTFARWGGEEFVLLFPETSIEDSKGITEKLRVLVEELYHSTAGNITVSFGLTEYKKNDTIESIFKRCDDALYEAKDSGRNCIRFI